jgi:hypothetical protein
MLIKFKMPETGITFDGREGCMVDEFGPGEREERKEMPRYRMFCPKWGQRSVRNGNEVAVWSVVGIIEDGDGYVDPRVAGSA